MPPAQGHSCHGLLVIQALVCVPPAFCLLKTFAGHQPVTRSYVQKRRKGETPLSPRGDLLVLQVKGWGRGVGVGAGKREVWLIRTWLHQQCPSPTLLSLLTSHSVLLGCWPAH